MRLGPTCRFSRADLHVIGEVMFLSDMRVEPVRNLVEIVLAYAANEAVRLHVFLYALKLVSKFTKSVDDQTCGRRLR